MTGWSWFWASWVAVGFAAEAVALVTNYKNTLSEQVWALEGKGGTILQFVFAAFLFWLFVHLPFHLFSRLR